MDIITVLVVGLIAVIVGTGLTFLFDKYKDDIKQFIKQLMSSPKRSTKSHDEDMLEKHRRFLDAIDKKTKERLAAAPKPKRKTTRKATKLLTDSDLEDALKDINNVEKELDELLKDIYD